MIIETPDKLFFRVKEFGNEHLQHVWRGVRVKKMRGVWVDCANARIQRVRKEGCRVVATSGIAKVRADIAHVAQACGWV